MKINLILFESKMREICKISIEYIRFIWNQYDINGVNEVFGPIAINNRDVIKIIAKTINAAGQEVGPNATGIVIEIYTDGTIRRVIR